MTSPNNFPEPEPDAGHVPITEELDSFKHTMPNAVPVVAAMLLVVVVLGILAFVFRAKPVAAATLVIPPGANSRASAPAHCRRERSSRTGAKAWNLRRIRSTMTASCIQL